MELFLDCFYSVNFLEYFLKIAFTQPLKMHVTSPEKTVGKKYK